MAARKYNLYIRVHHAVVELILLAFLFHTAYKIAVWLWNSETARGGYGAPLTPEPRTHDGDVWREDSPEQSKIIWRSVNHRLSLPSKPITVLVRVSAPPNI